MESYNFKDGQLDYLIWPSNFPREEMESQYAAVIFPDIAYLITDRAVIRIQITWLCISKGKISDM